MSYLDLFCHPSFRNRKGEVMPNTSGWQTRHLQALNSPVGVERCLAELFAGWAKYADTHRGLYDSGIGDDRLLGPAWANIGIGLRELLNGECGRLDGGTLDGFVCDTLEAEGFDPATGKRKG